MWNEPHLDPSFEYPEKIFCYCNHSLRKFKEWLVRTYNDLEGLNAIWSRAYSSWDDVKPPTRFGTYPDMIDWRHFWLENHASWLQSREGIPRLRAPSTSSREVNPSSSASASRSNPCRARGTVVGPSLAISSIGAFRTPAVGARGKGRHAGVRKPPQELKCSQRFTGGSLLDSA